MMLTYEDVVRSIVRILEPRSSIRDEHRLAISTYGLWKAKLGYRGGAIHPVSWSIDDDADTCALIDAAWHNQGLALRVERAPGGDFTACFYRVDNPDLSYSAGHDVSRWAIIFALAKALGVEREEQA